MIPSLIDLFSALLFFGFVFLVIVLVLVELHRMWDRW